MNKREARRWVREHWQAFMRSTDMPDTGDMPEADATAIFEVWTDESLRLADRLEPRRIARDDPRVRFVSDTEAAE